MEESNILKNFYSNIISENLDLADVCRLCLSKEKNMQWASTDGINSKLLECTSIELPPQTLICDPCRGDVNKWHSFKLQIEMSLKVARYIEKTNNNNQASIVPSSKACSEKSEVKSEPPETEDKENDAIAIGEKKSKETEEKSSYTCDICGLVKSTLSDIVLHRLSHPKEPVKENYQCDLCPKDFPSANMLEWHKQLHLNEDKDNLESRNNSTPTEEKPYKCSTCDISFKRRTALICHQSRHERRPPVLSCDKCRKKFTDKNSLRTHRLRHLQ